MMKSNDIVVCGHNWMNNFCPQCSHYYADQSFCYCKIPDFSQDMVNKAIGEGDRSHIYGAWTRFLHLNTAPRCLPCFKPKPKVKIPLWRLPVAIILGIVIAPIGSFVLLVIVHWTVASGGFYPRLDWVTSAICILMGCTGAVLFAVDWYKKEK